MHPFLTVYNQTALPRLKEGTTYASSYTIPRVVKVTVNMGVGDCLANGKALEEAVSLMAQITGQQPVQVKARKAIAGFKIRQGMIVGLKTTLRDERMYDFLSKLTQVALPRTRDFRGLPASGITASGSLNIGIRDSMIFPETARLTTAHGLQVTVVSTASTLEEARTLFEAIGFIFQNQADAQPKLKRRARGTYKR